MSHRIANLLNEPEQQVTKLIQEFETKNGYPSHDVRYLAENSQKIRLKMSNLGLDPNNTTPKEMYQALLVKFKQDSRRFEQHFGAAGGDLQQKCTTAVKLVNDYFELPQQWALKPKTAKQALKANSPKKLMKYLGYRSIDSMLKRENLQELYLSSRELESENWQKSLIKYVSGLDQTHFDTHAIKLVALDESRWSGVEPTYYATYEDLMGSVAIWPSKDLLDAPLLSVVLLLIEAFTPQINLKPGPQLVKMNMVMWWVDTDHLVAELDGQYVSLNLKDCALNSWLGNDFDSRLLDQGRKNFWRELVERYQNRPDLEPLFDDNIKAKLANLKLNIPEPVFDFAEEFDG